MIEVYVPIIFINHKSDNEIIEWLNGIPAVGWKFVATNIVLFYDEELATMFKLRFGL